MVHDQPKLSFHWRLALRWDREAEGQTSHQRPPAPVFSEFSCCTSFLCLKLLARGAATTLDCDILVNFCGPGCWRCCAADKLKPRRQKPKARKAIVAMARHSRYGLSNARYGALRPKRHRRTRDQIPLSVPQTRREVTRHASSSSLITNAASSWTVVQKKFPRGIAETGIRDVGVE